MARTKNIRGNGSYNVERIVAHRLSKNGKYEFFIKWEDYPEETNSWEPERNLYCPELLAEYKAKMMNPKESKTAENKENSFKKLARKRKIEDQENTSPDAGNVSQINNNKVGRKSAIQSASLSKKIEKPTEVPRKPDCASNKKDESKRKKNARSSRDRPPENTNEPTSTARMTREANLVVDLNDPEPREPTESDRNSLRPKKIMDAKQGPDGKIMFTISWEGTRGTYQIPAEEANLEYPQLVIDFYEQRIMWKSTQ